MASDMTILGCPISAIQSLEVACSATAIPTCALATAGSLGADCCGSLSAFATSVGSCFLAHAPTCLDTSAAAASLTAGSEGTISNPCAAFGTSGPVVTSMSSAPASATGSGVTTSAGSATATGSAATGSAATGSGATASGASSSPSASSTAKSAAPKIGAGLKVYIGVALFGALAVLNL